MWKSLLNSILIWIACAIIFAQTGPPGKPPTVATMTPARPPGTITVNTVQTPGANPAKTITVVASSISCVFHNPSYAAVTIHCAAGGASLLEDAEPGLNLRPHHGRFMAGGDLVEWELASKVVGVVSIAVTANGATHTDTF